MLLPIPVPLLYFHLFVAHSYFLLQCMCYIWKNPPHNNTGNKTWRSTHMFRLKIKWQVLVCYISYAAHHQLSFVFSFFISPNLTSFLLNSIPPSFSRIYESAQMCQHMGVRFVLTTFFHFSCPRTRKQRRKTKKDA